VRPRRAALALLLAIACSPGDRRAVPATTNLPSATVTAAVADLAYATAQRVVLRGRTGAERPLDTIPPDAEVLGLAWSADGRYVAWLRVSGHDASLYVHDLAADRTGAWQAPGEAPRALGVTGAGFVVVSPTEGLAVIDPARVLGGEQASYVLLSGLDGPPRLLAASATQLLVATGGGGPQTVYQVEPDRRTTRLFVDGDAGGRRRNLPMSGAALTADGTRLVYTTGFSADECTLDFVLVTRDLVANREIPNAAAPPVPADMLLVTQVTTGPDGRTFAAVTSDVEACSQPLRGWLYVLSGDRWIEVARDATWGSAAVDGRLAVIRTSGALVVDDVVVARGVRLAAWSPVARS
jgi:hypothetical protein